MVFLTWCMKRRRASRPSRATTGRIDIARCPAQGHEHVGAIVAGPEPVYAVTPNNSGIHGMTSGLPFDDIRNLMRELPEPDGRPASAPVGLGQLGEAAAWYVSWAASRRSQVLRPMVVLFAGNHGVASADGERARVQALVEAVSAGTAAVNTACGRDELGLKVFDLALHLPTADFRTDAALDEKACAATMAYGMEAVAGGVDLVGVTCVGAGGDLSAAAVCRALEIGLDQRVMPAGWSEAIDAGLTLHAAHGRDPLEVLRRFGGRETAAAAGAILGARTQGVPVVLDGPGALAAAAVLKALDKDAIAHCMVADNGEGWSASVASQLGIAPLLGLNLTVGDGTAAALALSMIRTATDIASPRAAGQPVN